MLAGLLATTASAALWLTFSTTTATPGTLITVRTLGEGSLATVPAEARLPVFLVRADAEVTSPDDDRLIPLGELTVDGRGNGELRFRVPDVPAGDYTTYTHCAPCAASSAGRELLPTGPDTPFVVLGDASNARGFPVWQVALGAAAAMVVLAMLGWTWRRRRTP